MTRLSLDPRQQDSGAVRQVPRQPGNEDIRRDLAHQAVPVFRGVTTTPMTAAKGGVDGYVMVRRQRWDGSAWTPAAAEPVLVYNDTKTSLAAAGCRCKYTLCEGYPTLLTIDSSPG